MYNLFPILKDKRKQLAGELSGGQRQQVAVARALMTNQKCFYLMSQPLGFPNCDDELFDRILEIAKMGVAILMVEQNAKLALEIANKGYVLVQGKTATQIVEKPFYQTPMFVAHFGRVNHNRFCKCISSFTNFLIVPALTYGSQLAIGALGVTVVYSVLRFSNFAHGETMAFGTMITILCTWVLQSMGVAASFANCIDSNAD